MRNYKTIIVNKKGEDRLKNNHPWVFEGNIESSEIIEDGSLVDVLNEKKKYLGTGFYNSKSKIRVRIISRNTNDKFDYEFFKRRVGYALNYRLEVINKNNLNSFRVIYGEADEFSGLTVDKFDDVLVTEVLSLGIDLRKDIIYRALIESFKEKNILITGIYERNDNPIRLKEGLEEYKGWYLKSNNFSTTRIIVENDIKYLVDFESGQKTGFFLDQKYNRQLIKKLAKGKNVLDVCTHTGSFAMNAYFGGAKSVTAIDISEKALSDACKNFELNEMNINTICGDAFEVLEKLPKKKYDFIILDPPAFTKSKSTINNALKGYERLNYLGMKLLPRGGFLATASCSHFASEEDFKEAIRKASVLADVKLKLVSATGPSPDHPELIGVPETKYLKFFIFQVF